MGLVCSGHRLHQTAAWTGIVIVIVIACVALQQGLYA